MCVSSLFTPSRLSLLTCLAPRLFLALRAHIIHLALATGNRIMIIKTRGDQERRRALLVQDERCRRNQHRSVSGSFYGRNVRQGVLIKPIQSYIIKARTSLVEGNMITRCLDSVWDQPRGMCVAASDIQRPLLCLAGRRGLYSSVSLGKSLSFIWYSDQKAHVHRLVLVVLRFQPIRFTLAVQFSLLQTLGQTSFARTDVG